MKWDLGVFYKNAKDPEILEELKRNLENMRELAEKYENRLNERILAEEFENFLRNQEKILERTLKVVQFAGLYFSENTQNPEAQKLLNISHQYFSQMEEVMASLKSAVAKLSDEKLTKLSEEIPQYSYFFEKIKDEKKHILSKDAEQILAATSISRRDALAELYEKIVSSYTFEIEIDGEKKVLNDSQMRALRKSPDGKLRKEAMRLLFKKYEEDKIPLNGLYNIVVKDYDTEARLRKFPKPISMRNLANSVTDESVNKLIEVTTENTEIVHKYYKWKAKKMEEKLTLADIYAPITNDVKKYSFDDAKEIVIEAYYEFNEQAGKIIKSFFDENRIHSDIVHGKAGGAFCSYYTPKIKPFILMNFNGNISDVMTLAHELGHGLHGTLSAKQTLLNYHTPLTMAELASVFGEFLVFDKLKSQLTGKEKISLIASTIEETFATMFRQNMFARFEIQAHENISKNGFATWEELSEFYKKELKVMFGNSVEIPPEYHFEWATIPHLYHTPFYVYAYNFANCIAIAIYQKYLEEGKRFVPKYIELLESGGKDKPERLLKKVGIDLGNENFWQKAFDYLKSMVDEISEG
ncbi:M3 family oligoendopeptidase [Thermosipho ferrireducens]|uniref:M3 family oligoendopeptidase n=1 Tax=Thermosipho ferrireducens TaxID=2571116 RepID=A0ABX7S990_9BACT|nr:M3 family oligoendopeptidase [Thermosipho ferrireducens]QTA38451.1 M3 family oligoendopeptidase [Thermosipho ferrireducens]